MSEGFTSWKPIWGVVPKQTLQEVNKVPGGMVYVLHYKILQNEKMSNTVETFKYYQHEIKWLQQSIK